jgi:phosphatidylglycerophosphatase C
LRAVATTSPLLAAAAMLGGDARDRAKAAMCSYLLAGSPIEEAELAARRVAGIVVSDHLRDDVVSRLMWHQSQSHHIIVVSASFEPYVRLVCAHLGVEDVFASRWQIDSDGQYLTGRLEGANVRGEEKARIIREQLGIDNLEFAYGDSAGDAAMLALAKMPVRVSRKKLAIDPLKAEV